MGKWKLLLSVTLIGMSLMRVAMAAPPRLAELADLLPEWPVVVSEAGSRLILSDSPEDVAQEGILYQDKVKGDVRLFFHHVNVMTEKKRIVVMLFNSGNVPAKVDVLRYGVSGPGPDYMKAGRDIQLDYFRGDKPNKVEVLPGKSVILPAGKVSPALAPQMILTGMIDFRTDQEVRLVVAAIPEQGDPASVVPLYDVMQPAQWKPHLRGTFAHGDRVLGGKRPYDPGSDGPVAITIGDGDVDSFLSGQDVTNGKAVRNQGNYGVVYRLMLPTVGKGKVRCYLNPRGGAYTGWAAVQTRTEHKLVATPSRTFAFGIDTLADFELIAEFPAGELLWVTLSPPGASNLPIRLMLVPAQ